MIKSYLRRNFENIKARNSKIRNTREKNNGI
jgi:hypothetical protein